MHARLGMQPLNFLEVSYFHIQEETQKRQPEESDYEHQNKCESLVRSP